MANLKCDDHSGFKANINELCEFKRNLSGPEGTLQRIFDHMETKVGRGLLITFTILILGLLGTLYGLTYRTQYKILNEMTLIKIDLAVIKEKVK
jgi:hypothetical protein